MASRQVVPATASANGRTCSGPLQVSVGTGSAYGALLYGITVSTRPSRAQAATSMPKNRLSSMEPRMQAEIRIGAPRAEPSAAMAWRTRRMNRVSTSAR